MSFVIAAFERCARVSAQFGKMRRDKLYVFGLICIFGWMIMTYILFTHKPPMFESKFTRSSRSKIDHDSFLNLNKNIDRFSVRLRQQMRDSENLLLDLNQIVDIQKSQKIIKVIPETTTQNLQTRKNVVIPILMFACNRVSITKAIDPLLLYRGKDPARKARFPIIISQVSHYILKSTH